MYKYEEFKNKNFLAVYFVTSEKFKIALNLRQKIPESLNFNGNTTLYNMKMKLQN